MTAQTILPANSVTASGYDVDNSLRFNFASSDGLTKTLGTPTDNKKWTYSFWVKQCSNIGNVLNTGSDTAYIYFRPNDADPAPSGFSIEQYVSSFQYRIIPNMVFRDHSAWRHIVIAFDTTQGTDTNRVKVYNNGTQITSFNTATYPSQNLDTQVNSAVSHKIGGLTGGTSQNLDGYLSEVCFIDGQQLAPTSFGEFDEDSGIWKPIDGLADDLTFGDNGFYLEFKQSGTGTNASGMGADTSGNDNHFAVANLTAVDQSTDTCTNNFSTLNPLDVGDKDGRTLSNGNLDFTTSSGNNGHISGTLAVSGSGKWYFETKILAQSGTASSSAKFGIIGIRNINESSPGVAGNSYYVYSDGRKEDGDNTTNSAHPGYVLNDIVQVALDLDNGNVYFGLNGDWGDNDGNFDEAFANATAFFGSINTNGFWTAYLLKNVTADNVLTLSANFGSPSFAISSGNADGNGHGNFEFAVPSGYFAFCTKNLAEYG
jgi:hypothetical protein